MTAPRAAALRLDIASDRDASYLITASVPGSAKPWTNRVPRFSLAEARLGYAGALDEFKRLIGRDLEPTDWNRIHEALHDLRLISGRLISALATPRIVGFRRFVERALDPLRTTSHAPLVEVHAPSDLLFPLELIQVRPGDWPPEISDRDMLFRACMTFLGFSTAIRRVFTDTAGDDEGLDQNRVLRNRRRLPLTLFQEASTLAGARAEEAFFRRHQELFRFRAWPSPRSRAIEVGLAAQLFDSRAGLDGAKARSRPDEIQHFACHCATTDADPLQHALRLGAAGAKPCVVTLGRLDAEFGLVEATEDPLRPGPLVFLNACGSAAIEPGFSTSFVQWFLRNQNRGVIGTETPVPDTFAAAFAARFYTSLLAQQPAGQALISAKHHMARLRQPPRHGVHDVRRSGSARRDQGRQGATA